MMSNPRDVKFTKWSTESEIYVQNNENYVLRKQDAFGMKFNGGEVP